MGDTLRDEMFRVEYGSEILLSRNVKSLRENAPEAKVFVGSAMTRSTGICDLKYVVAVDGDTPVMLGVQLQANALKLFLEMDDKAKAKKTADALWKPNGGRKFGTTSRVWMAVRKNFQKARTKPLTNTARRFFYRSIRLGPTSPKCLVETIVAYARLIRDNEVTLRQQVETVLGRNRRSPDSLILPRR